MEVNQFRNEIKHIIVRRTHGVLKVEYKVMGILGEYANEKVRLTFVVSPCIYFDGVPSAVSLPIVLNSKTKGLSEGFAEITVNDLLTVRVVGSYGANMMRSL